MSEQRRNQDGVATPPKGPMDRLGKALKPEDGVIEIPGIRQSDLEPYVGLRYLSKLFKLMGVILVLLLIAEVVTGVMAGFQGESDFHRLTDILAAIGMSETDLRGIAGDNVIRLITRVIG